MKSPPAGSRLRLFIPPALAGGFRWYPELLLTAVAAVCVLAIRAPSVWSAFALHGDELPVRILVPFVVIWLIWSRRDVLRTLKVHPWWPGLLGVAAAAALSVLADLVDLNALRQLAVIAMLQALVPTVLGPAFARALAFPLLFLLFAVNAFLLPLVPPLLNWAAALGVMMLRATGVPVVLSGLTIVTPFGQWLMTDNCSGVEYMLAYAIAGTLFVSIAYRSTGRRVAFVLAALIAAMLANGLRVWSIVFATYVNDGNDPGHEVLGWLSFALPLVALFAVGRRFIQHPSEAPRPASTASATMPRDVRGSALAAFAAVTIVGAAAAWAASIESAASSIPTIDGCHVLLRDFVKRDGASISRTRTVCAGASGRRQLLGAPMETLDAISPDSIRARGVLSVLEPGHQGAIKAATLTTIGKPPSYRLTYWYEIGDFATGSWFRMKLRLALALFQRRDAQVTVVTELQQLDDAQSSPHR